MEGREEGVRVGIGGDFKARTAGEEGEMRNRRGLESRRSKDGRGEWGGEEVV